MVSSGSPSSPISSVSSAASGASPSASSRALARARSSSCAPSSSGISRAAGLSNGITSRPSRPPTLGARHLLGRVARDGVQHERARALVGAHEHERPPAIRVAQPVEHLGRGLEPGEALEHLGHLLGEARIGGHAPVLAPPVEPAARQPAHGLVQLLVERELEDDLRVPGVVREQPDPAPLRLRLVRNRLRHELTRLATPGVGSGRFGAAGCKNATAAGRSARRPPTLLRSVSPPRHGWRQA